MEGWRKGTSGGLLWTR